MKLKSKAAVALVVSVGLVLGSALPASASAYVKNIGTTSILVKTMSGNWGYLTPNLSGTIDTVRIFKNTCLKYRYDGRRTYLKCAFGAAWVDFKMPSHDTGWYI
ncbi:MAG: hypothetical protein QM630_00765 [Microbacterium sp.]